MTRIQLAPFSKPAYLVDLLRVLVDRDMKLRYKRSILGIAWSLLNPLAQLLVFSFVFHYVLPLNIPNYASFLFTGLLAWNWFQASLLSGTGAIVDNRELVKRPGFPALALPVVSLLPLIFAVQFALTVGLVYFAAAIYVTFRDTQYLLGIALMLGFYLSPVLYDAQAIPVRFRWFYQLNPLAILIGTYRSVLLEGQFPSGFDLVYLAVFSALLVWAGYRLFMHMSYRFMEEL
jgi:lipopolysaccharide transport system permease protein